MGPVDKQKREIQRDLKRQKAEVAKAKKITENLMLRLQEAEGRLVQTENAVEELPALVVDNAMNAITKKKDLSLVKSQLEQLATRLNGRERPVNLLGQSFKLPRLTPGRAKANTRTKPQTVRRAAPRTTVKPRGGPKLVSKPRPVPFGDPNPVIPVPPIPPLGPRPSSMVPRPSPLMPRPNPLVPRPNSVAGRSQPAARRKAPQKKAVYDSPVDDEVESDDMEF